MNIRTSIKTAGVIVIGALGSALWDLVKPGVFWLWASVVNFSSLGIQSLSDDIYIRAAGQVGNVGATLFVAQVLTTLLFTVGGAIMQVLSLGEGSERARQFARPYMYIFMAGAVILMIQVARGAYSRALARDYEHLELIASPYMSDIEQKKFRAALATVKNEGDFRRIMNDLNGRAQISGVNQSLR